MSTDKFDRVSAIAQHAANECERLRAVNAELVVALRECITSEGAACFGHQDAHPEWMKSRLFAISDIARAAIAKVGQS